MGVERKGKILSAGPGTHTGRNSHLFCYGVNEAEIRKAIRAGSRSLEAIRSDTCANTGCGGCQADVEAILEDEVSDES